MEYTSEIRNSAQYLIGGLYIQLAQTRSSLEELRSERMTLNLDQVEKLTKDYAASQDRVAELERKLTQCLESTASDSAKAKEAATLKAALKKSHATIDELNKTIKSLEKDRRKMEREAAELRSEVSKKESARAAEEAYAKSTVTSAKADMDKLTKDLEDAEKALVDARAANERKTHEVETLQDKLAAATKRAEELEAQVFQADAASGEALDKAVLAERDKLRKTVERLQACITTSTGHLRRAAKHWDNEDDDKAYNAVAAALKLLAKNTTKESEN
ncbi:hypothetical protein [Corynebacterium phoceense]